jgi:hypothetical protein
MSTSRGAALAERTADKSDNDRPSATYFRRVVRSVMMDSTVPVHVRHACERLMLVINANDLSEIGNSLKHLQHVAQAHGVQLPWRRAPKPAP